MANSCDFNDLSTIHGEDIWGGEDTPFNTTRLSHPWPSVHDSAVEAHKRVLAEGRPNTFAGFAFNSHASPLGETDFKWPTVEAHKAVLREEAAREAALAFNTLTTPLEENDVEDLQWIWTEHQKNLNTKKAQPHINTLLKWILADGGKDTIVQNIRKAIKTATHKRDLKTTTLTYDDDDTITENGVTYRIDWLVKKTDVLSQIAKAFNETHFVARRSYEYDTETNLTHIHIILEFWP